jgi:hypothetical protein
VDDQGYPVERAGVSGYWISPVNKNYNATMFFSGTTDAGGIASLRIDDKARPGEHRITIENITK